MPCHSKKCIGGADNADTDSAHFNCTWGGTPETETDKWNLTILSLHLHYISKCHVFFCFFLNLSELQQMQLLIVGIIIFSANTPTPAHFLKLAIYHDEHILLLFFSLCPKGEA